METKLMLVVSRVGQLHVDLGLTKQAW